MKTVTHKRAILALALVGSFASGAAWSACAAPLTPTSLPDGRTADMQVMLEARRDVEQYLVHVADYFDCENNAVKLQEVKQRQKLLMTRFNAEVRAFNAASRTDAAPAARLTPAVNR